METPLGDTQSMETLYPVQTNRAEELFEQVYHAIHISVCHLGTLKPTHPGMVEAVENILGSLSENYLLGIGHIYKDISIYAPKWSPGEILGYMIDKTFPETLLEGVKWFDVWWDIPDVSSIWSDAIVSIFLGSQSRADHNRKYAKFIPLH
jgi:hypothetical protein